MKLQIVAYTLGILITIVGVAELLPALIDFRAGHPNSFAFFFNACVCVFFGGSLVLSNKSKINTMSLRQLFVLTVVGWTTVSLFCALPIAMSDLDLSFTDAYFEAASGVTTTGATILPDINKASDGLLVWRSMMQWFGGFGTVAFAIILLPYLKVGGMQIFKRESASGSQKVMPRSTEITTSLIKVYILLTALCMATYFALGMSGFDAINHAMTTISTGGFSTHNASFGAFESAAMEYAAIFFMLLGALPFVLYIRLFYHKRFLFLNDEQFLALTQGICGFVVVMTLWLAANNTYAIEESFRVVLFHTVSILTTSGFTTMEYTSWGGFPILAFLLLTYMGGCAGSTAGGAKMMRIIIGAKVAARQFNTLIYPNGVFVLNYQGRRLDNYTVLTVLGFLSLYVVTNVAMTIALAFTGLNFETALSASASALANVGPGIGSTIGPGGNYSPLPAAAKWILSLGMILGRLEILTVLVLLAPSFWRR